MKTRRSVYIVIGCVLIAINGLVNLSAPDRALAHTESEAYNMGYLIGSFLFSIIGLVFLLLAYRLNRKLKAAANSEIERSIDDLGKGTGE